MASHLPPQVSRREALIFWCKLGFLSFGGPAGQIAMMHRELVEKRRWVTEQQFLHGLHFCMILPGPEATQLASYIGWLLHKTWGGIAAGLLFILPGLLLMMVLGAVYSLYGQTAWVAAVFYGIQPAVVAIVCCTGWRIATRTLNAPMLFAIALAAFVALYLLHVPFPWVMLSALLMGIVLRSKLASSHQSEQMDALPVAARRRLLRSSVQVLGFGLLLWSVPFVASFLLWGWQHPFTQMAWFFSVAAMLTFGGAYAVLPFVYQGVVDQLQWVSAGQMMDGIALGESTPGPLIVMLCFIGFLIGYSHIPVSGSAAFLWGALAALWVGWFTFLPSFVLILMGAPWVAQLQQFSRLQAPLKATTAAVVGVIASLALFFAEFVLWNPEAEALRMYPLALTILAATGLLWGQWSVQRTIGISLALGCVGYALGW